MDHRTLGEQGLVVSALGYGTMGTVVGYGPADDAESVSAIRRAHELGVTHFDTAEMYGWGAGEELLGRALAPVRDEVTIATKFGLTPAAGPDSRPGHIREVVEASLRRLGVEHIDLLYQHAPDPEVPVEDVIGTMSEFVTAGKVRYLGVSNADADHIARAHAVHPLSAVQQEYSLFARGAEDLFPLLDELGIGLVAYSPLARGFLSGTVPPREHLAEDDFRQNIPWWDEGNFDRNLELTRELADLARARDVTLPQLALAWLLHKRGDIVPIPGSRTRERVGDNVTGVDLALTGREMAQIAGIVPHGGAA